MIYNSEYSIATGHDNEAGFTVWEAITVNSRNMLPVSKFGEYDPGEFKQRNNGTYYQRGSDNLTWIINGMFFDQYRYLMETYCSNAYSGLVTIRTLTDDPDTYANKNATLHLPKWLGATEDRVQFMRNVPLTFVKLIAT